MEKYHETLTSLLNHHINFNMEKSDELKEAINTLNMLFFLEEQKARAIREQGIIQYIKTDAFQSICASIDHNKVKLIKIISSL
jgi:hypothetical protein